MMSYEVKAGDPPMIWVSPGTGAHGMGFHVSEQVREYVLEHGLGNLVYNRKLMQGEIDKIASGLPALVRPANGSIQIGDLVRVGTGKIRWRVMDISKISGFVRLASENSSTLRTEMPSNLKLVPPVAAAKSVASTTAATIKASRSVRGGTVGLAVGAVAVLAGAGVYAVRRDRERRRAASAGAADAVATSEELPAGEAPPPDR